MSRFYAGIGPRDTAPEWLEVCERTAEALAARGWTLRTGHAPGADQAFGRGAGEAAEVYLPWPNFEKGEPLDAGKIVDQPERWAFGIAERYHPNWVACSAAVRRLLARNVHQLAGVFDRPHSKFVITAPFDGGGTAQTVRLAQGWNIPVFDLGDEEHLARVEAMIRGER